MSITHRKRKRRPLALPRRDPLRSLPLPAPRPANAKPETLDSVAAREDARATREVISHRLKLEGLIAQARRLRRALEDMAHG